MDILSSIDSFLKDVNDLEIEQMANIKTRKKLEESLDKLREENVKNLEALDIASHAIEILRGISDEAVQNAYKFLEDNLNSALDRMFYNTTRKIRIVEYTRANQYPQLELELTVGNGKVRSIKNDSGHGLAQIVSLLSILCLIVITGSRRFMILDEVLSGVSQRNRKVITDILWAFTEIGFQFIINEHGYVPKGSKVYHLEMVGDISKVKDTYIEKKGIYLDVENAVNREDTDGLGEDNLAVASDLENVKSVEVGRNVIDF